jgi:hypothetical protein
VGQKQKVDTGAVSFLALGVSQVERKELVFVACGAGKEVMESSRSLVDLAIGHLLVSRIVPRMAQNISYVSLDGGQSLG